MCDLQQHKLLGNDRVLLICLCKLEVELNLTKTLLIYHIIWWWVLSKEG
ncbi:hypothetical protein [Floridanema evergladense]|uniref:Uncharacterized protein n=1 Tax=Floridaenema evergladense BLCC-F167 TaxID=3153639 RepID=A0ABV4WSH2_9CYAN